MIRLAFAGFRHVHVMDVYSRASSSPDVEIVAACEEDKTTRDDLASAGKIHITHDYYISMLDEASCDAVVVADYFSKRGSITIEALKRGKHVLSDKPLCTTLAELETIKQITQESNLQLGLMLDLRDCGHYIKMRELVKSGMIGEVQSAYVGGQHALLYNSRPHWYYEAGKHGGTINDVAIHGLDLIEWITGLKFLEVTAARTWNAFLPEHPDFHTGAQFIMKMENGCGVIGDASYFAPNNTGGSPFDPSWRITLWGKDGVIETSHCTPVKIWRTGKPVEIIDTLPGNPGGYLSSFVASVEGDSTNCKLTTRESLRATEVALKAQKVADEGLYMMKI